MKLLVSLSVFNPALLPIDESTLSEYGNEKLQTHLNSMETR